MKEKKGGGFLRWPWNVAVYVALFLVLRIFAIPIILILMAIQRKNNPNGAAEGYCLSRTRKRLAWLIWALLVLALAGVMLVMLSVGLKQDRAYFETMDYVTLAFCGVGGLLFLLGGLYLAYVAIRDSFFPAKSTLAKSIRSQLPYPDEAPPVEELFAMVDKDLEENGQWFDAVGIGREWVLGEKASRIDRIRGIFTVDEIRRCRAGNRTNTSRVIQLVLVDDRWQTNITDFKKPQELRAAADCLALRVPEARRGENSQWSGFWNMDESQREEFEREFRQRQSRRASEELQRKQTGGGPQDMILEAGGEVTSRVTETLVEEHLRRCLAGEEGGFTLTPTRPVEAGERTLRALRTAVRGDAVVLVLELAAASGGERLGLSRSADSREAREILAGWLRREVPNLAGWDLRRVYEDAPKTAPSSKKSQARLSLVYASGAAENHTTFTAEDVQAAAEGIVDGTYQLVDLTHPVGYLWIRVTAGDKLDGRCTVEATRPDGAELGFYITKMPPREAAAWLTDYPRLLPEGRDWKKIKKPK